MDATAKVVVEFTVKELLANLDQKMDRMLGEIHLKAGREEMSQLSNRVDSINTRLIHAEREMATKTAVEKMEQLQARSSKSATLIWIGLIVNGLGVVAAFWLAVHK